MSISANKREKKNIEIYYNKIIGGYKRDVDGGKKIEDLYFDIFRDRKDYFIDFMKKYINCKKKIGFEL
jgi:hypothetical protein